MRLYHIIYVFLCIVFFKTTVLFNYLLDWPLLLSKTIKKCIPSLILMDKAGPLNSTEIEIKKLADLLIKGFLNVAQIKKKLTL